MRELTYDSASIRSISFSNRIFSASSGKSYWLRVLWIVGFPLLGAFVLAMFRISLGVLIPKVMSDFSLSEVEVGAILSSYFAAVAMVMALGGYASDRLGRKVLMGLGTTLMACGILLFSISTTYSSLVASMFISGIGLGLYLPTSYAYVGEVLPTSRGFLVGVTNSVWGFGGFLGPLVSGFLAEGYGWRMPVMIFGVLSLFSSVAIWSIPYVKRKPEDRRKIPIKSIIADRELVLIAIALGICDMGILSSMIWTPKFLIDWEGFTIADAGLAFGIFFLSGGVGCIVLGWFSDRFGRRRIAATASLTAASLALLYYLSSGYPYFARIAFSAVFGFVSFATWNISIAAAQDLVDPSVFGSVTGFVQNIAFTANVIIPVISGSLIAYIGLSHALTVSVCIPYLFHGLVFVYLSMGKLKQV